MKNPEDFQKRLLKNPWFLWILIILGVNPVFLVGPALKSGASHLDQVADEVALSTLR